MARNIRWYIPFKSFNGVDCRVNIYDNNWPAEINPARLVGSTDPFYFEEDNSSDLLEDVVRYSTGYIRIVQRENDIDVDAIYPTDAFDRYVEVLYGSVVVFKGYLQVQDFTQSLEPLPKEVEFPVISQLGLFDKRRFSNLSYIPPRNVTLGELLDTLMADKYERVYVPYNYGYPNPVGLWMEIHSLVISPWNKDFHHSIANNGSYYKVMKPETHMYLINAICKAFGWICHDTPSALVFTAYDFKGQYCYYPVGHIGDGDYLVVDNNVPTTAQTLTDYLTPSDNKASTNTLLPDTGIEISYDGDFGHEDFSFDRTTFNNIARYDPNEDREQWSFVNLNPVDGGINEISSVAPLSYATNNNIIQIGVGCVAWNGNEGVLISFGSWSENHTMFKIRWYRRRVTNLSWKVTFDVMTADYLIGNLKDDDEFAVKHISTTTTIYDNYVEVSFNYIYNNTDRPALHSNYLALIHNIKFNPVENNEPYAEYFNIPSEDSDFIPEQGLNHNTVVSSSVTMPISLYRNNSNLIGSSVRSTKLTEYPYLFQPRIEMKYRFKLAVSQLPVLAHAMMFSYLGKRWRIIAADFYPWNDEYLITMQYSPVLND